MTDLKFGRLAPTGAPALALGPSLTGVVPAHPDADDNLAKLGGGWKMLGNDRYGDCVSVSWANERRLVSAILGTEETYPTLEQVEAFYKTQNPGFPAQDGGMVIQTALETLVKEGGPDGVKALAFAKVDHTNPDEVKAAIALFGSVWTGITVTQENMNDFQGGDVWQYNPDSPVEGGHSVVTGGYGGNTGDLNGADERFITWAQETAFSDDFWSHQVEEAWVVIWPEHLGSKAFLEGVNLQQLAADYTALTGKAFPESPVDPPEPPTPPNPEPTPAPSPADVEAELEKLFHEFEAWIEGFKAGAGHPTARDARLMASYEAYRGVSGR